MIERSVPGCLSIISMIETLTEHYAQPGSTLYDLGFPPGAATLSMRHGTRTDGWFQCFNFMSMLAVT
jgi:tRNA (cmo5U34)-methyltransferase